MRCNYRVVRQSEATLDLSSVPRKGIRGKIKVKQRHREFSDECLIALAVSIAMAAVLFGCAPPPISELLKDGVNCRASITMPSERPRESETIDVAVKIYECKEVKQ